MVMLCYIWLDWIVSQIVHETFDERVTKPLPISICSIHWLTRSHLCIYNFSALNATMYFQWISKFSSNSEDISWPLFTKKNALEINIIWFFINSQMKKYLFNSQIPDNQINFYPLKRHDFEICISCFMTKNCRWNHCRGHFAIQ